MKHGILILTLAILSLTQGIAQTTGSNAPDFTFDLLDGGEFTLSDNLGKVVMVFLFGNTCNPCILASPGIQSQIIDELSDNSNFVAVGVDVWDGSVSLVNSFKSQSGLSIPLGLDGSSIASTYSSSNDRLLVIDQEGIVRHNSSTSASSDISNVKQIIDTYLEQSSDISSTKIEEELKVYPNPSVGVIHVKLPVESNGFYDLSISDISGRIVQNTSGFYSTVNSNVQLDMSDNPNGIYFLSITINKQQFTQKITLSK